MATYVLNQGKMFCDIADGIAIVINTETGFYYGMNNFGTAVFENIMSGASIDNILDAVKALPNAPHDVEDNLHAFVGELKKFEIIIEGAARGTAALDASALGEDGFTFTVQEYSDAQELLLADPIHEVRNETGWQPEKGALETDEEIVAAKHEKIKK
jgi:hypothetical protein